MDVVEFQNKLQGICALAKENGNVLTQAQIREYFAGMELETAQLLKVLQYLKVQGIAIEGAEAVETQEEQVKEEPQGTKTPLTAEEEAYLKAYMNELAGNGENAPADGLFEALGRGDGETHEQLTQHYLPVAAEMAAEMNCEEIALADLIQEANLGLLMALSAAEPVVKNDVWVRMEIRKGIIRAIEEQTQRKFADDYLVAKVEKLESAVKELADDDGETKFSVDELAVILDMEVDEIRNVLRLTGDDK